MKQRLRNFFLAVACFTLGMLVMGLIGSVVFQNAINEIMIETQIPTSIKPAFDLPGAVHVDEKTLLVRFRDPVGNWRWFKVEFNALTEKDTLHLSPYLTIAVRDKESE